MAWDSKKWIYIAAIAILMLAVIASGCCCISGNAADRVMNGLGYKASSSTDAKPALHGTIEAGAPVLVKQASVGSDGGKIRVDQAGSPVEGLTIDVPAGAYASSRSFTISSAPVTGDSFGQYFTPASPLISIDNGGGYAEDYVLVRIPVNASPDNFVMAFIYDEANQSLEGLPIIDRDESSITIATLHFCKIIASAIPFSDLDAIDVVDSGFRPGTDDFEFSNGGSVIAPGGQCAGQSLAMMWYYTNKRQKENAPSLYGLYDNNGRDKTPGITADDVNAYRLASVVQNDINWDYYDAKYWDLTKNASGLTHYYCFKYAIYLTGEPQHVGIYRNGGGHAIVCYKIEGNTLYVADPNYPGEERTIVLKGDTLGPYSSGANSQDIAANGVRVYDRIYYYAKTALIPVYGLPARWGQLEAGTIGDGSFPPYTLNLTVTDDYGKQSYYDFDGGKNAVQKTATVEGSEVTLTGKLNPGVSIGNGLSGNIYVDGKPSKNTWTLHEGHNLIGVEGLTTVNNQTEWIGFDWIDLYYEPGDKKLIPEKLYYDSGALREERYYYMGPNGKTIDGEVKTYYESGGIHYISNLKDGKRDGKQYTYLEDGTLYLVEEYKNGIQDGHTISYSGGTITEVDYSNGKQVEGSYKVTNL